MKCVSFKPPYVSMKRKLGFEEYRGLLLDKSSKSLFYSQPIYLQMITIKLLPSYLLHSNEKQIIIIFFINYMKTTWKFISKCDVNDWASQIDIHRSNAIHFFFNFVTTDNILTGSTGLKLGPTRNLTKRYFTCQKSLLHYFLTHFFLSVEFSFITLPQFYTNCK